ncbi:CPBP family intramembrane glutamic endopeptidase [Lacinutrix undariae]
MYIEQAFKGLHDWWRYAIGTVLIIFAVILGQIPISIAFIAKAMLDGKDFTKLTESEMLSSLEPNLNLFLLLLSFAIGLVGVFVVAKTLHKQTITQLTTSRKKIDWKRFWFSFAFWGIISTSMIGFDYMSSPENYVLNFKLVPFIILCVIAIVMIPLQTSFEEYLFRGYFMQGLGVVFKNKWVPLLLTSLVFGLLHIANPEVEKLGYVIMVYYIGTGLFLGVLTLMDEGMELSLGFHAANNLFTAVLVTADWTAFQTHSVLKDMSDPEKAGFMDVFFPVFVMFPIILFIFSKVYKWTDWKAKLFGRVVAPSEEII